MQTTRLADTAAIERKRWKRARVHLLGDESHARECGDETQAILTQNDSAVIVSAGSIIAMWAFAMA